MSDGHLRLIIDSGKPRRMGGAPAAPTDRDMKNNKDVIVNVLKELLLQAPSDADVKTTTDKESVSMKTRSNHAMLLDEVRWQINTAHGAIEAVRSLTISQLPDGSTGNDLSVLNRCHLENLLGLINRQPERCAIGFESRAALPQLPCGK